MKSAPKSELELTRGRGAAPTRSSPLPVRAATSLEELVRKLIELAPRARAQSADGADGVLLSAEGDGIRCLLTRPAEPVVSEPSVSISPREQEIARMVAKGYPDKAIAAVLEISKHTVGTHLR